ncbi:MAG: exonuclease [Pseudomonadota bacterium]
MTQSHHEIPEHVESAGEGFSLAPSIPNDERTDDSGIAMADTYFSADVETDGPIPGPFSMLSFALVKAGSFDGARFVRPASYDTHLYLELRPVSGKYDIEALRVTGINRDHFVADGHDPRAAMTMASEWVAQHSQGTQPVLVAYPLGFDWTWLYWYFMQFSDYGSPFLHSKCFDLKTAYAVKAGVTISQAGRSRIPPHLRGVHQHTHHALDDAIEQAELFANVFEWRPTWTCPKP